jgi:hypothetical protein
MTAGNLWTTSSLIVSIRTLKMKDVVGSGETEFRRQAAVIAVSQLLTFGFVHLAASRGLDSQTEFGNEEVEA